MANTYNIQNIVVAEGLRVLSNELVIANKITRQYEDKFNLNVESHRTGATITIPKPPRSTVRTGWTMQTQNAVEESVTLTIDTVKGDDYGFTDADLALLIPDPDKNMAAWSKRFLKPRITRVANAIDLDIFQKAYVLVPNLVGIPGVIPQTYLAYAQAMQKLDENLAPQDDRYCIINPAARAYIADALKGTYVEKISAKALLKGFIPTMADFEVFMSQNVPTQTVGALGGTPLVNAASQLGSNLVTNGWSNSITNILNKGDIITLAGVNQVNPVTGTSYGSLQQFVVTANVNSDSSGNATIPIFPAIVTSGATQTVTGSPAGGAAITVVGTAATAYAQNLIFHKDAFTMAFAKLHIPGSGVEKASQATYDGFTMRYVRGYDIQNAQVLDRIDCYYGFAGLYQSQACRLTA